MRPCLTLDQDDLRWLEAIQITPDHRRKIEWRIGHAQPRNRGSRGDCMAGGRASGQYDTCVRIAAEPLADEFQGQHGLAHAHRVDVHRSAWIEFLRARINRRPLTQPRPKSPAPQHFHNPPGKRRQKQQRQQTSVDRKGGEQSHRGTG